MKNFNVEWIVPLIIGVVFVVGNIMRILNWKNEQDKKATKRPREFQIPKRPPVVQPVRESDRPLTVEAVFAPTAQRVDPPPRPLGRLQSVPPAQRQRPQLTAQSEEVQKAIRKNRAKAQRKQNNFREVVEPVVIPVVEVVNPRENLDRDVPPPPDFPQGEVPSTSGFAMSSFIGDLTRSPDGLARAMILQVIFAPPLSRRRFPTGT
jgi:hypothetical protein